MSDVVIRARKLRKVYRLYAQPRYRILDVLGLLRSNGGRWAEHVALDDIDIDIRRGEKVAIIGRNGAGKSTLLKLITGVIEPTSGELEVKGEAQALLQVGVGLHPDFTGRQNIISYLAHLGITGSRTAQLVNEIIEFAEIEEYIDQPVKTYSTGMGMRLMFAASTVISPDVLVIDEVLGVGDAYFTQKSFERVEKLCSGNGSTLLLVSHDIYSAAKLCDRMIWIDRGVVLMDAAPGEVIKSYEHSIRLQEESRLRAKAMQTDVKGKIPYTIEFSTPNGAPPRGQILVASVALKVDGRAVASFSTDKTVGMPDAEIVSISGRSGWRILSGNAAVRRNRLVLLADTQISLQGSRVECSIDYHAERADRIVAELWGQNRCLTRNQIALSPADSWQLISFAGQAALPGQISVDEVTGAGRIWFDEIKIVDRRGEACLLFRGGDPIGIRAKFRSQPDATGEIEFEPLLAFHSDGVEDVLRLSAQPIQVPAGVAGEITFHWSGAELGEGRYTFTFMAVRPGYFDDNDGRFHSINNDVYFVLNRGIEFAVRAGGRRYSGTRVLNHATSTLRIVERQ